MKNNREFELKIMLSQNEYEKLDQSYDGEKLVQTNFYFDTVNFDIYKSKRVVRLRKKRDCFEITIKSSDLQSNVPGVVDMNESTIKIDETEAHLLLDGRFSIGMYLSSFEDLKTMNLAIIGSVETTRKLIRLSAQLPFAELDMSTYNSITDYELEWEIEEDDYDKAKLYLEEMGVSLSDHDSGVSKYKRFIESLGKVE